MNKNVDDVVNKIKNGWDTMDIGSLDEIQKLIRELALGGLDNNQDYSPTGIELFRDKELGFILTAYSEINGTYRVPHNHGNSWVIYSVIKGSVEMGNYFNWEKATGRSQLIVKDKIILKRGDINIYYPGEIHDTRCLSENALILRLTSCDLKVEEAEGRMKRFNMAKSCSL